MNPNPFVGLLHSRKFLIAVWDFIVGAVALVGGWYLAPQDLDKIIQVFALLQVPVSILIGAIAWEDNAERKFKSSVRDSELSWEYYKVQEEKEKEKSESEGG
jgi:hypothetical protein